jgi:hypothetical protein
MPGSWQGSCVCVLAWHGAWGAINLEEGPAAVEVRQGRKEGRGCADLLLCGCEVMAAGSRAGS